MVSHHWRMWGSPLHGGHRSSGIGDHGEDAARPVLHLRQPHQHAARSVLPLDERTANELSVTLIHPSGTKNPTGRSGGFFISENNSCSPKGSRTPVIRMKT